MMKQVALCSIVCILGASPVLGQNARPSASFSVSQLTAIPGKTLPPGQYTIHVIDHLSDRYVLRVDGTDGQDQTEFLGIPDQHLPAANHGMILWKNPADGATYVRGWRFASVPTALEFAYPKTDAVAVAKANHAEVPAIDPESEGMPGSGALSKNQMQIVSLWLLTPTKVGPSAPAGISARHYQEVASMTRPPAIKRLPHTASNLPLVWLAGGLTLLCGLGFRMKQFGFNR